MYYITKKIIDISLAIFLLVLFLPIFFLIFFLIFIIDRHYPFFIQQRTGFKKKIFNLYKFKTMKYNKITKLGFFLRKIRMDELPQLVNILKNDMSFVGPRPLLIEYLNIYNKKQLQRFDVPQGLTCMSQIKGGNMLKWKRKLTFDIMYSKNKNLCLDIKILLLTFFILVKSFFSKETDANVMIKLTKEN